MRTLPPSTGLHIPQSFAAGSVEVTNDLAIELLIRFVTSVKGLARCSAEDARHAGIIAEFAVSIAWLDVERSMPPKLAVTFGRSSA
jgi:hypothetical protein